VATPATTMEGVRAKAAVVMRRSTGDLSDHEAERDAGEIRIMAFIVRDLIQSVA
jgi:hypothetical protein